MIRYTGHAQSTIARWLNRMGTDRMMAPIRLSQGLVLTVAKLDELHAKARIGVQSLWRAIGPVTKIIPSLHSAGIPWIRKQEDAFALLHSRRLTPPNSWLWAAL